MNAQRKPFPGSTTGTRGHTEAAAAMIPGQVTCGRASFPAGVLRDCCVKLQWRPEDVGQAGQLLSKDINNEVAAQGNKAPGAGLLTPVGTQVMLPRAPDVCHQTAGFSACAAGFLSFLDLSIPPCAPSPFEERECLLCWCLLGVSRSPALASLCWFS